MISAAISLFHNVVDVQAARFYEPAHLARVTVAIKHLLSNPAPEFLYFFLLGKPRLSLDLLLLATGGAFNGVGSFLRRAFARIVPVETDPVVKLRVVNPRKHFIINVHLGRIVASNRPGRKCSLCHAQRQFCKSCSFGHSVTHNHAMQRTRDAVCRYGKSAVAGR